VAPALTSDDAKATDALMARFETVVFVAGGIASHPPERGALVAVDSVRVLVDEARRALDTLRPGAGRSLVDLSTSVVLGARDFRAPSGPLGLGGVRSTRCFVFALRPGAKWEVATHLASGLRLPGTPPVWTWKGPPQEGDPEAISYYAAQATPTLIVLGNDLGEVRSMCGRLAAKGSASSSAVLSGNGVSSASAWAYRRYRRSESTDRVAAGIVDISPSSEALIVVPDASANRVDVRLLDAQDDSAVAKLDARSYFQPFKREKPGVWRTSVALAGSGPDTATALMAVWYLLGFGIYL
jgi:hypothetical protein